MTITTPTSDTAGSDDGAAIPNGAAAPRIAIFNVKYSPNLGDGLLSECLEAEVRAARPGCIVESLDLAGRAHYGEGGSARHLKLALLELMPPRLRRIAAGLVLRRLAARRLAPLWRRALAEADAVVVGGGNLFADADLNFPIKLATALDETSRRRLPVAVYGVGVTANWSPRGRALFGAALGKADVRLAQVRDERSCLAWNGLLDAASVPRATITNDPGLLAARHFPVAREARRVEPVIALGITDPLALRYHGGTGSNRMMADWFAALVDALAARPCRIRLFTNGSPEDRRYLDRVAPGLVARAPASVSVEPAFDRPAALAGFLAGCDLVMAHRMHACIAAYAYRVPTIGFVWDIKLRSFFELTQRPRYIIDPAIVDPADAARLAFGAIDEGIGAAIHHRLVERARHDVAAMVETLLAGTPRGDDPAAAAGA